MPKLTLADLQARTYARLDQNTQMYTLPEVTSVINEAIKITNLLTGFLQIELQVPGWTVANRVWYDVPPGIVIPLRASFEGTYLQRLGINPIGKAYPNWTQATTANSRLPVTYWVPFGLNKFAIFPADALGGNDLRVTGVQEPTPLINPGDVVNFNNDVLTAFDLMATHVLQLKESPQMFAQGSTDYIAWQKQIKRMTIWQGMKMPKYWVEQAPQGVQ